VRIEVVRDGSNRTLTAALDERPANEGRGEDDEDAPATRPAPKPSGRYGMDVEPLTPEAARQLRTRATTGVVIAAVDPAGVASEAGLQAGDVIVSVNRTKVADGDALREALERAAKDRPALLLIDRRGQPAYIPLEKPAA
jgi:serine protease Do